MFNVKREKNEFKDFFKDSVDLFIENNESTKLISMTEEEFKYIEIALNQELLIVLAKNKYLQNFINDKFNTNYSKYYETYIRHGKDIFVRRKEMLDISSQDTLNKLIGILSADVDSDGILSQNDFRVELIKRGYKDIYRQVKSMQLFNIFDVFNKCSKKRKGKAFVKRELADISIISYAVAVSEELDMEPASLKYLAFLCQASINPEMVYDKLYLIDDKENRLCSVIPKDLLDTKKYTLLTEVINKISTDSIDDAIMADAMEYYASYLQSIGVDVESFIDDLPYTKDDVTILTTFLNNDTGYILSDDSKKAIFSALLMLLAFKKRYDEAKNIVLNKNAESRFHDALEYENKIKTKEEEIKNKIKTSSDEINSLKKELDNKENEISELKNQLKKQQDIINKNKDNSKELLSLRKAIYSINNDVVVNIEEDMDTIAKINAMKNDIKNEKIIIFGGRPKWINMLKEELPSFTYFSAEDINRDISCIKKCKAVYINTQVLSHAFYYKIVSEASKHNVGIEYITNTDKESIIRQIYNNLYFHEECK